MDNNFQSKLSHTLVRYGMFLFLLGLLTGFVIPLMRNPRMGLASHLEAVMNGMFLILLGLIWHKLRLSVGALKWGFALSLFGTYTPVAPQPSTLPNSTPQLLKGGDIKVR